MDLGAYVQIEDLDSIAKENGIYVPRLRGYRLMVNEKPIDDADAMKYAHEIAMNECEMIVRSGCDYIWTGSKRSTKRVKKYMYYERVGDHSVRGTDIKWDRVHGKLRKKLKFEVKKDSRNFVEQNRVFNSYCGKNVLYIHARIGGGNWETYRGEVENQPWFIEKVDDAFDSTYCDIYARLK